MKRKSLPPGAGGPSQATPAVATSNHGCDLTNDETLTAWKVKRRKGDGFPGNRRRSLRLRKGRRARLSSLTAGQRSQPDWSALPDLPLGLIARRLRSLMDFFSFRAVCTSWRAVGRAIQKRVMASHPPLFFGHMLNSFYHLAENRVYERPIRERTVSVAGFSHGLLILYLGRMVWLANPLTGAEIHCFPRIELSFCYALLSSPPTSPGCVLVAYGKYAVQYCRPGDKGWITVYRPILGKPAYRFHAVAIVGGKGYVLMHALRLATFDFNVNPVLTIVQNIRQVFPRAPEEEHCFFFAESKGEVFVFVTRQLSLGEDFGVFRFDTSSCKWVRSEGLGGCAVFVDVWKKGPLFVENYAEWGGSKDCIYFFDSFNELIVEYTVKDRRSQPFLCVARSPVISYFRGTWVLPSFP